MIFVLPTLRPCSHGLSDGLFFAAAAADCGSRPRLVAHREIVEFESFSYIACEISSSIGVDDVLYGHGWRGGRSWNRGKKKVRFEGFVSRLGFLSLSIGEYSVSTILTPTRVPLTSILSKFTILCIFHIPLYIFILKAINTIMLYPPNLQGTRGYSRVSHETCQALQCIFLVKSNMIRGL